MKRHEMDVVSLVFGIFFALVVGVWLVARSITVSLPSLGWFVAGALILLGLVGLSTALLPRRR